MTARTLLWDGITVSAAFGVILLGAGAVKLTLAAIGTLDGEAHPLLLAMSWLHRLSEKIWPARGRHHTAGLTDEDTDTLNAIRAINAEHHVKPHDPPGPARTCEAASPGGTRTCSLPPGHAGTIHQDRASRAGIITWSAARTPELDALDQLIEAARQHTVADPQLLPAIRAALGFDSVDCYLDSMRRKLSLEVS